MQPGQAGGFVEHRNDDRQAQSRRGAGGFGRQVGYVCTQHHLGDLNIGSSIVHAQYMGMWRGVAILLELRTGIRLAAHYRFSAASSLANSGLTRSNT